MDGVKDELKKAIDGRKYLLVLDDVWNESHFEWRNLEVLLACGAEGSKILITARAGLVARASSSVETHVLKGLSNEESWALFKQMAFKQGVEQVNPTMERIGKAVVEKCVGVPLVVKAIGCMLAVKEGEGDWLDFEKNDLPRVAHDSEGTVLSILRLSYDNLAAHLKRCFVFCAIYPKDYLIQREELIGMWMAHGLIQQLDRTPRSLEDVGKQHFEDLLDRSFFEVHDSTFLTGTYYKMHDLIHDLAQSVGGEEYYNTGSGTDYVDRSTRHAWVIMDEPSSLCKGEKLCTLALSKTSGDKQNFNEQDFNCTSEQLRVLILRRLRLTSVPQFVDGLRHLYYLDLSWNNVVSLPESICRLYNLQTLILYYCKNLEELPVGTRDLVSLRRLDVRGCRKLRHMPRGLEELTCLQTLNRFVAGGKREEGGKRKWAEVYELKSLVNLRGSLAITNLGGLKCERNESCILMELKLVEQLKLEWEHRWSRWIVKEEEALLLIESLKPHPNLESLIINEYPGSKYPSWMDRVNIRVSLPNIVYIGLNNCGRLGNVAALGLLPCLQQLHLYGMHMEYLIDRSSLEEEADQLLCPSLKELNLRCMWELKSVVEPTEAANNSRYFPVLEILEIYNCPLFTSLSNEDGKLFVSLLELHLLYLMTETLPSWVQYLPHLQTLELRFSNEIVSLPEWMGNLTSLQELQLQFLDSLASIPDCLQRLTSLQWLVIETCRKLKSRCEKETGNDWHKIAHIPNIKWTRW